VANGEQTTAVVRRGEWCGQECPSRGSETQEVLKELRDSRGVDCHGARVGGLVGRDGVWWARAFCSLRAMGVNRVGRAEPVVWLGPEVN
jgi:hypothetical protein